MGTVTQTITGQLATITNRDSRGFGACGTYVHPGTVKPVKLSKILGNAKYMDELNGLIKAGYKLSVAVDGCNLLFDNDINYMDATLPASIRATRDIWTNPATADPNAFKTAFTAPAVATTYSGSDLNGATGQGRVDFARNVTIRGITGLGEALTEKSVVLIGEDIEGVLRTETMTVSTGNQGASDDTTYQGVYAFKRLVSAYFPAEAAGSPGDYEIGFGNKLGLSRPLSQGGPLAEFMDNAIPGGGGTFVVSGTGLPNGTYTPNTAPNGAHDYIVVYTPN